MPEQRVITNIGLPARPVRRVVQQYYKHQLVRDYPPVVTMACAVAGSKSQIKGVVIIILEKMEKNTKNKFLIYGAREKRKY